ncbi:MAG: DUF58 domain-containing protein [Spirochaetia bacterium]|jgi:uncharacterized protein (DUF58 family)|nr:DUF58 domain-containing protein [Spirochaetia bacterium]
MANDNTTSGSLSLFGSTWALFLLGLLLVVAAVNSATLVVKFAAMVLVLMGSLRLWTALGLWRLELEFMSEADRLFPGDCFNLRFNAVNRKLLPLWIRIDLPVPDGLEKTGGSEPPGTSGDESQDGQAVGFKAETSLQPYEHRSGIWTFQAGSRGVHQLGPVTLTAGDVLGVYRREKLLPFRKTIVVFPRLVPIIMPELPFLEYFGIHPSKGIIEDPAWYEGTREYSGDKPARHIHWKVSARLNQLHEKIFQPTSHRKIYIILDGEAFSFAKDHTGFETAVELAASLASAYAETGASIALATDRRVRNYPSSLDLGRGPEQLGRVLELLARCEAGPGRKGFLSPVRGISYEGCGFIVVSRCPDDHTADFFRLPVKRKDRLLFIFAIKPDTGWDTEHAALGFDDLLAESRV